MIFKRNKHPPESFAPKAPLRRPVIDVQAPTSSLRAQDAKERPASAEVVSGPRPPSKTIHRALRSSRIVFERVSGLKKNLKPKSGFANLLHLSLVAVLPALIFVLVRVHFAQLALAVILLSKWRIFALKPRHWPANLRANGVDIIVGLSLLAFMLSTDAASWQLVWTVAYSLWLMIIKPRSTLFWIAIQAYTGQTLGLVALFLFLGDGSLLTLVLLSWLICYLSARHFLAGFDERLSRLMALAWGSFAASLVWLLTHWLLFYGVVAQPAVLLSVLGFGLGTLYYLEKTDRLSVLLRRQCIFIMVAIIVIIIVFANWSDKAI